MSALTEFKKLLSFALSENELSEQDEERLDERGRSLGLSAGDVTAARNAKRKPPRPLRSRPAGGRVCGL